MPLAIRIAALITLVALSLEPCIFYETISAEKNNPIDVAKSGTIMRLSGPGAFPVSHRFQTPISECCGPFEAKSIYRSIFPLSSIEAVPRRERGKNRMTMTANPVPLWS